MFKTRFISMLVLLMTAVTGAWATITVTWNADDITGSGNSFTKDGVTITAGSIDFDAKNFMQDGTFTTTLGNFTKIEVTAFAIDQFSGTGWSGSNTKQTWTGNASSVSFNGNINGMMILPVGNINFVFTIEPATANACGDGVTWALDNGVLTISYAGSGTGAMDDFDYEAPWSAYQDNITSVVIEDGVTSVGARAFTWCSNLTSVSLPASLEAIGAMAFARCGLTSITLPASLETIGMRAFQDTKITSVNIPASVASIDELAFGYCGSLAEITVADGNTVYEAPNGCNALIVKATHTLIQGCNGTVFANLPADLKSIGEAAFAGCTSLTTVTFPDGLESIGGNAFESCSGLTTVTIPASVNTVDVNAFAWCDNLTTVTIYATSLTTYGEGAFDDAASGLKIYVPYGSGDTYKAGWADYASKIEEMAAASTYTVTLKEGTEDATSWTIAPAEATTTGVAAGTEVKATYGGMKKVKSVKAVKKAPAVAEGHALSASVVGDIVGTDGKAYAVADKDNLPEGVTAVAMVAYKSATAGSSLAIALADQGSMRWSTAKSQCAGKTTIGGKSWKLPSQGEWKQMFSANGDNEGQYTGLNTAITNAGGTALASTLYWSSSSAPAPDDDYDERAWAVNLGGGGASWESTDPAYYKQVRACLAF